MATLHGPLERHQPRLCRVERQTILTKTLRQDFLDTLCVLGVGKTDDESSGPGELHPQALAEPDVELAPHPALLIQSPARSPSATDRTGGDRGVPPDLANELRW